MLLDGCWRHYAIARFHADGLLSAFQVGLSWDFSQGQPRIHLRALVPLSDAVKVCWLAATNQNIWAPA
jgi:hypothetical protein